MNNTADIPDRKQSLRGVMGDAGFRKDGSLVQPSMRSSADLPYIIEYSKDVEAASPPLGEAVGADGFSQMLYKESRALFGHELTVPDIDKDTVHFTVNEAGFPYLGREDAVSSEDYFAIQAEHFGRPAVEYAGPKEKAPHNVVWAIGEDTVFGWGRVGEMAEVDRQRMFEGLTVAVTDDAEFISEVTGKDTVQIATNVGYDPGFSAPSKEAVHVHVLGKREEQPELYDRPVTDRPEKRKFIAAIAYARNVIGAKDEIAASVSDSVRKFGFGKVDMTVNSLEKNPYAPLVFKIGTPDETTLPDILQLVSDLHMKGTKAWDVIRASGREDLARYPSAPSFTVGCDYTKGRISNLTITPSLYGYVVPETGGKIQFS